MTSLRLTALRAGLMTTAAMLGLAAAPAAWAQDPGIPATEGSSSAGQATAGTAPNIGTSTPAAEDEGAIEEIVVTAQRVSERLQDVPLAVTALSAETLAERNITDITRLQELAPGLSVGRSGSDARPAIRGINTEAIGANSDPRIAFYVDDIYQSRTSQALAAFVDLERVEVQRGPQGTLYGRNSFGGNIALYSATPKDEFGAGGSLLYGRFDRLRAEGFVNVPLADGLGFRVAGMYEQADGYVKNTSTGSDLGDEDQYFVRGTLRYAPSGSGLEIVLRGSYWDQGGDGISAFGYKSLGTPYNPSLIRQPGQSLVIGGRTVIFPAGFNGGDANGQNSFSNSRFRDNIPDVEGGADIGIPIERDPYKINFDTDTTRRTQQTQLSANISYDFGPATIRSITGWSDFYAVRNSDNDFSPFPVAIDWNETSVDTLSQELQILSSDRSSPFQWIIGGYYYDDRIREIFFSDNNLAFGGPGVPLFNGGGVGLTTTSRISLTRSDAYGPVQLKTTSYAGFAQASYTFAEKLRFTGGVRYTSDEKAYNAGVTTPLPAGVNTYQFGLAQPIDYSNCGGFNPALGTSDPAQGAAANALRIQCGEETFDFTTYRGAVDFKITPDNLVYASISSGRRSGGFNNVLSDPSNINSPVISFAPEEVTAYEIGTKNQFLDNRLQLNIAGFYNDYEGLQVQRQVPAPNGLTTFSIIENSGKGRSYGVEIEAVAKPTRALTVQVSYVWLDSRYTEYETGTAANGLGGLLGCPVSPNGTSLGRDYACEAGGFSPNGFPFPNGLSDPDRFRLVTTLPNGAPVFNYVIAGDNGAGGQSFRANIPLSPRHTLTAGAAYEIDLGVGTLTPGIQTYLNSGFDNLDLNFDIAKQKAFTKTDARLTFITPDGNFTVQGYIENIEDTAVLNRTAIGANRSINAVYSLPQTYGIKAGVRF